MSSLGVSEEGVMVMPVREAIECKGKQIELEEGGYLARFEDWNEGVARALAAREGIGELSVEKVEMLKFIRQYYQKYNFFPILNSVCKNVHQPKHCMHEKFLNPLVAWKLAGLPRPEEPVTSLLEAGQSPG